MNRFISVVGNVMAVLNMNIEVVYFYDHSFIIKPISQRGNHLCISSVLAIPAPRHILLAITELSTRVTLAMLQMLPYDDQAISLKTRCSSVICVEQ